MLGKQILLFFGISIISCVGSLALAGGTLPLAQQSQKEITSAYESELTTPALGRLLVMAMFDESASTTDIQIRKVGDTHAATFVPGRKVSLEIGEYIIDSEDEAEGSARRLLFGGDCSESGTVEVTDNATGVCLITLSEEKPEGTLIVNTIVINDDLGDALSGEFPLAAGDTEIISAIPTKMAAGEYLIQEFGPAGYDLRIEGDCDASGKVNVPAGGRAECTFVHDDTTPTEGTIALTTNPGDGAIASDEVMFVVDGEFIDDAMEASVAAGNHTIEAYDQYGNALRLSGDCAESGEVMVKAGREAVCTVTSNMFTQTGVLTEG